MACGEVIGAGGMGGGVCVVGVGFGVGIVAVWE